MASNMTLREKQSRFILMVAELINHAYIIGYEMTFGDTYRNPLLAEIINYAIAKGYKPKPADVSNFNSIKLAYGNRTSWHPKRLAIDLHLFSHGQYLTETEDHILLGEFWEDMGGTWGGRWGDGNHYSYEESIDPQERLRLLEDMEKEDACP